MEYVTIEKQAFEQLKTHVEYLTQLVEDFSVKFGQKNGEKWLDAADVCAALDIGKRTLQYYRESGKIPFTKMGYKYFYNADLIHKILQKNSVKTT